MSALAGPGEALLISAQGEAGQRTAAAPEAGLIRGLTETAAESGRVAGACSAVAGVMPRDQGCSSTQRAEGGTVTAACTRGNQLQYQTGKVYLAGLIQNYLLAPRRFNNN